MTGGMEFDAETVERVQHVPGNSLCADCGERNPEWVSVNLGVVVCLRCSGAHRSLGTHISQVKSLKLDNWKQETLEHLETLGNEKVNAVLETYVPSYFPKPGEYPDLDALRTRFIQEKYQLRAFEKYVDEEEDRIVKQSREGFLLKQSKNDAAKWQKRWLVLSEGALSYYRSQDSQIPSGTIRIGSQLIVKIPTSHELIVSTGPGYREFRFRTNNAEEVVDWLISLRASRSIDGRGSILRRVLSTTLNTEDLDDGNDETPPGSAELSKEAFKVLNDGHHLKQGWLLKRQSGTVMSKWVKRYFVLIPEGAIYYFKSSFSTGGKWRDPMGAMYVVGANVECDSQRPFAMAIRCPEGQLLLAAEDEDERDDWMTALKTASDAHLSPAN